MPELSSRTERLWYITRRWQQYEGEARVNILRISAIGVFYLIHLWHQFSPSQEGSDNGFLQLHDLTLSDQSFHLLVTLLALAWLAAAAGIHFSLRSRFLPPWLSALSTFVDVVMLTSILWIAAGPRSPLVVAYFLVIAAAGLRFDVRLVQFTTIATVLGYVCLLGLAKWPERFGRDAGSCRAVCAAAGPAIRRPIDQALHFGLPGIPILDRVHPSRSSPVG